MEPLHHANGQGHAWAILCFLCIIAAHRMRVGEPALRRHLGSGMGQNLGVFGSLPTACENKRNSALCVCVTHSLPRGFRRIAHLDTAHLLRLRSDTRAKFFFVCFRVLSVWTRIPPNFAPCPIQDGGEVPVLLF